MELSESAGNLGGIGAKTRRANLKQADNGAIGAAEHWSGLRIVIVGLCFLLNAIDGMDVVIMSYIAPVLSADWQVSPETLGMVFSASLAGMVLGCFFVAPLADRWGRRPLIIIAMSAITACMILSGFARSLTELVALRFIIGIWIGAILASMAALAAEFAPTKQKALGVAIMNAGYPLGAVFTGLALAPLLPHYGWHMMLLGAGIISLVIMPLLFVFMPESIDFLVRRQPKNALERVNKVLARLGEAPINRLPPRAETSGSFNFGAVFHPSRLRATVALWIGIFMGFMSLYFVISWITKLAAGAGLSVENAIYVGAIMNFGAFLGTVAMGKLSNIFPLQRVGAVFLTVAAAMLVVFGTVAMPLPVILANAFVMGMAIYGGFNSFYGLAALLYPAAVRSTGIGWAMGAGRFGAVVGPTLGGVLIGAGASLSTVMIVFAVPLLVAAVCALFASPK
ncbi:MFS transporter [Paenirhodobacter populi]|nr:MFS transporter [Sinirhodobacter populi]